MKGFLAGIIRGKLFGNSKCTNTYIVHNVHIYSVINIENCKETCRRYIYSIAVLNFSPLLFTSPTVYVNVKS